MKNLSQKAATLFEKSFNNFSIYLRYFIIFFALIFSNVSPAQDSNVWNYPVHYGTSEWSKLSTFKERLNAYNIPEILLMNMTTENLVKTCLEYPEWLLISGFNNFNTGYNAIKSVFNGFTELENRPDAFAELLKVYQKMDPDEITKNSDKGEFTFEFTFIELLLSQYSIISNLSNSELILLMETTLSIYEKKCKYYDIFSSHGLSTTCLLLGRALKQENSDVFNEIKSINPDVEQFMKDGPYCPSKILLDLLFRESKEYLRK